jgi:uncharacterized membrane protein (UPF0127 family)
MRALMLVFAASLAVECTRTPNEDFATQSSAAASPAPAASSAFLPSTVPPPAPPAPLGRCVKATPAAPPPAVPPGPAPGCPADPEGGPPKVPLVRVAFADVAGVTVEAELVASPHDTTRGLMYRKKMAEDHGMLFNLPLPLEDHAFWMHNTCIPLDLLYIDDDGLIVGIVENAPTLDDSSRSVGCLSHYVLEVNAGWARRHGVKAGQRMNLPTEVK